MPVSQNTTDWVVLQRSDLLLVLEQAKLDEADINIDPEMTPGTAAPAKLDGSSPDTLRSTQVLALYVARFREAVKQAGRYPLSLTANAVPTEATFHLLRLTAFDLLSSTPRLAALILTKDLPTWQKWHEEGMAYLQGVKNGAQVTVPKDPTGEDYTTAPSNTNPLSSWVKWSDLNGTRDEYAQGYRTTSTGAKVTLPLDDMTTY